MGATACCQQDPREHRKLKHKKRGSKSVKEKQIPFFTEQLSKPRSLLSESPLAQPLDPFVSKDTALSFKLQREMLHADTIDLVRLQRR